MVMLKPTKILVPTDFSEYSDKALMQALDIASDYNAEVHVLHVADEKLQSTMTEDHADMVLNFDEIRKLDKSILKHEKERLHDQVERCAGSTKVSIIQKVTEGIPYEEILLEAEKLGIDLIVIASLGKSAISRFLIGDVARNVLKGAKCPVLLTK
ncbi:MAG: universal stress protein [Syntrophus sp. (in: bacteria)]|nr:universal stress protein [Syntrophus sp. (in: bacteria)]